MCKRVNVWRIIPVLLLVCATVLRCPAARAQLVDLTNGVTTPPIVTIRATDPIARESGVLTVIDPGVFTVHRTGPTNEDLLVYYTVSGTASNGVDYIRLSGVVAIPKGACTADITVYPLSDGLVEGTETVVVKLQAPVCIAIYPPPPGCYVVGRPDEATVYILDYESPNQPPLVRITRPSCGDAFPAPANILIRAEALDFDGCVTNVTFLANDRVIGAVGNTYTTPLPMQPISFELVWTNVPVGRYRLTAVACDNLGVCSTSTPVCILVYPPEQPPTNVPPVVSIVAVDPVAAEGTNCISWPRYMPCLTFDSCGIHWVTNGSRPNTATFIVRRIGPTNDPLTVFYQVGGTASNGVDYLELPGMVTIPAGRRCAQIVVVPNDDALPEPIETVVLRLVPSPLDIYPPPYYIGRPGRAAAIIVDNDKPRPPVCTLPDRCFHVCWPATNGQWFRVECSTNLIIWTPVVTNLATEGAMHFVDPENDGAEAKFYRVVPELNPPDLNTLFE